MSATTLDFSTMLTLSTITSGVTGRLFKIPFTGVFLKFHFICYRLFYFNLHVHVPVVRDIQIVRVFTATSNILYAGRLYWVRAMYILFNIHMYIYNLYKYMECLFSWHIKCSIPLEQLSSVLTLWVETKEQLDVDFFSISSRLIISSKILPGAD